jgi:hypothetical protein
MNRVLVFDDQIHDARVLIVPRIIFGFGYKFLIKRDGVETGQVERDGVKKSGVKKSRVDRGKVERSQVKMGRVERG